MQLDLFQSMSEIKSDEFDLHSYDTYILTFSGGKDSTALFLDLLEKGVPKEKIELWHHDIDGEDETLFDWECTKDYCRKFAEAFGVKIYFSYKQGGFLREMLRKDSATAPIYFESPDGLFSVGGKGPANTRLKFPQIVADLKTRWCSSYLKIDVGSAAIRNQKRFLNSRTLVLSGERGEESASRAKYNTFEIDRADSRKKLKRHVDRARTILNWTEEQVWEIIARWKIQVHPAYYLGWGRVSCKWCIFGSNRQFASANKISPVQGRKLIQLEEMFGYTLKRDKTLSELIASGTPYDTLEERLVSIALSHHYNEPIFIDDWKLPAGAFGESCGPT